MYHKISEMCDKISVIKEKAELLRQLKYTKKATRDDIDFLIADIQQLCREVGNDTGDYSIFQSEEYVKNAPDVGC